MSERDVPLSAEGGFGAALDEDLAANIPLVGFDEDDAGLGDIAFIGFDDAAAAPSGGSAAGRGAAIFWRRLGEVVRSAGSAARLGALRLFSWLHYRLLGTSLRARRSRAAAVFLGAVLLSIGCGLVLRHSLPARPAGSAAKAVPVARAPVRLVLVARQAIGRGRVLTAADLQWVAWPASGVGRSYVERGKRKIPDFYGYVARQPIAEGQPISSDSIINPGKRGALAAVLAPGMRAVSVDIREETAASGLVMPGDDVDLLLVLPVPAPDRSDAESSGSRYAVQTVLRNVQVLAIDQEIAARDGRPIIGRTATLEVTPKEAEIVALAGDMAQSAGNLRLALRSLVPAAAASTPAPGSPEKTGRSFLVESDISRLMPEPKDAAVAPAAGPLTIVRRGRASSAQPSPAGS